MPQGSIHVRLDDEQRLKIEKFRRDEPDIPSKPEAVRRLIERAIAAREADDEPAAVA